MGVEDLVMMTALCRSFQNRRSICCMPPQTNMLVSDTNTETAMLSRIWPPLHISFPGKDKALVSAAWLGGRQWHLARQQTGCDSKAEWDRIQNFLSLNQCYILKWYLIFKKQDHNMKIEDLSKKQDLKMKEYTLFASFRIIPSQLALVQTLNIN